LEPLPNQFWEAVFDIYNHYLSGELATTRFIPSPVPLTPKVIDSIQQLCCWLEVAIDEGWLDQIIETPN